MSEWKETEIGNIPIDWEVLPIGEIGNVTKLAGFEYTKHITYVEDGEIIALRALNVRDGKLDLSDVKRIYRDVSEGLERSKLIKNDILFTYVGANIGQFALVPENDKFHLAPNICRIRCAEHCHPYFLFSYFRSEYFKESLDGFSHGSSQPTMPMGSIRQIPIPIPPIEEQRAIAEVLSSLDDKIDLLQRQNQTLEQMAETLFRQWFVEEAEEDWEEGVLGDLVDNIRDSIPGGKIDPESKYIALEHIEKRNISLKNYGLGIDATSNKYQFKKGDILFGKLRPYFHKVCISPFSGICSTDILVLRPKKFDLSCFALFAFFQDSVVEYANLGSNGTRMPRTNWKSLSQYPIQHPNLSKLDEFNSIVEPSIRKVLQNITHIRTLESLRDTLLPKLMQGEIRIKEVK